MIKAFIFDLDGTLVDTEELHYLSWKTVLQKYGVTTLSYQRFLDFVGTSNEKVARDYIESDDLKKSVEELVLEKQHIYMEMISEVKLCKGVTAIIEKYHDEMVMAVASSSHKREVCAILEAHNLSHYFSVILGGDMVEKRKPHPDIYVKARSLLGMSPHECLAFEDTSFGINAAKESGIHAIAIPNKYTEAHDFSRADYIVNDLSEVNDHLLERIIRDANVD